MRLTLTILALVAIVWSLVGTQRTQVHLRLTTLLPAGRWALGAVLVWSVAFVVSSLAPDTSAWQDALWYAAALLAICPPIAVLGARRPGAGVWTLFVVCPLLAVLGWPLLTLPAGGGHALRLETPQLVGFVLVLLMGAGNYLGTRFSLSAAIYVVSVCLLVGSVSAVAPTAVQGSHLARLWATIGLGLAVLLAQRSGASPVSRTTPDDRRPQGAQPVGLSSGWDRLWSDYRDTFGIVWARRFQDRLNGIAAQQQWPARLSDAGIVWQQDPATVPAETGPRIDQTFRWLLRRFVDPEWIDQRLSSE